MARPEPDPDPDPDQFSQALTVGMCLTLAAVLIVLAIV